MIHDVRKALTLLAMTFGLLCLASNIARAESWFEMLVMPGELAEAHAKLQSNCQNCHSSFDQGTQPGLCLNCHKDVAADVTAKTGFHGRSPEAVALACSTCHNDHQGRAFNMVPLDPETFDHSKTDFALVGAHAAAPCESCHLPGKKLSQAPSACIDCHKADDAHNGTLGTDCASCHGSIRWAEVKEFDHTKTKFPLIGRHADLNCDACHEAQVWKGLPVDCVGCHKIDDVHKDRFGPDCAACHETAKWVQVRFAHDRDTKFALTGKHKTTACEGCHLLGADPKKTPQDCVGCHLADDVHKASLGTDCASCHGTNDWVQQIKFDHDLTKMPLLGMHAVVPCEGCHVSKAFGTADTACASCHMVDDVHKAALGQDCATCHNPNGWAFWRFDHDIQTDFALTGAHKNLTCEACHTPGTEATKVKTVCAECHQKQDVHKGAFGSNCGACHQTTSFKGAKLQLKPAP